MADVMSRPDTYLSPPKASVGDCSAPAVSLPPQGPTLVQSRKRIFYILDSFQIGGTESQAVQVAARMHARGHQVTVGALSMKGPLMGKLQESGVRVMSLSLSGGLLSRSGIARLTQLSLLLRRESFDLVHAHDFWSNLLAVPAARLAGVPAIISRRSMSDGKLFSTWRGPIFRFLQRRASFVLANSLAIGDLITSREGVSRKRVWVVHNGIDSAELAGVTPCRTALSPSLTNKKIVVMVANMYYQAKGHAHLIDAAPQILAAVSDVSFVLVGDGYIRAQLEHYTRDRGVAGAFLFLGRRTDIAELLGCCDLAVLPSLTEGLPNSVLEYMSAGLPVVATRVGGIPELITNNQTGILVPPGDSPALATAIIQLLKDPAGSRRLGAAAREKVRREFSFERLALQLEQIYSSCSHDCKRASRETERARETASVESR